MEWAVKSVIIWLSFDVIVIATIWYLCQTIPQLWPTWWREVVVDVDPAYREQFYFYLNEVYWESSTTSELKSEHLVWTADL